jgi:glycosyltransferase involved in cell wall biosynthesis
MVAACPYPVPQGSQVLLRDTACALRDAGHDVHLVVYGYGIGEDDSGLPVHRCAQVPGARKTAAGPSFAKPFLDRALVKTLKQVVREHAIDLVHAHNYEGLMVAQWAGVAPVVYHAHNAMIDELPHFVRPRAVVRRFGTWLDRRYPRRAQRIFAPHHALAEYLIACGCVHQKVSVIPPSVDAQAFTPMTVGEAMPPILYTGNLDAYQNLPFLERVVARVREQEPDARFLVATNASGSVAGAEHVPTPDFAALRDVLAQDAVFVCPRTSWSGYPIKLLNALAAGQAIVACAGAAHPLAHKETALVVPDNDETAFVEAVLRLLREPETRRRLGEYARGVALEAHDPAAIAARIGEVYGEVARGR